MTLSNNIQTAIYTALKASAELSSLIIDVFDNVPLQGSAQDDSKFPFVVIGQDSFSNFSTNTTTGFDGSLQIKSYARSDGGFKEVKQVESAIYEALDRIQLPVSSGILTTIDYDTSNYFIEPDGLTQTAITTFRILVDNV